VLDRNSAVGKLAARAWKAIVDAFGSSDEYVAGGSGPNGVRGTCMEGMECGNPEANSCRAAAQWYAAIPASPEDLRRRYQSRFGSGCNWDVTPSPDAPFGRCYGLMNRPAAPTREQVEQVRIELCKQTIGRFGQPPPDASALCGAAPDQQLFPTPDTCQDPAAMCLAEGDWRPADFQLLPDLNSQAQLTRAPQSPSIPPR
jgi:hypothetical protein